MILHLNHTRRDSAVPTTSEVVGTLLSLLQEGQLDAAQFARLQIHLDWIQYRQNFREAVTVMRAPEDRDGTALPLEIRIDGRQVAPGSLRDPVQRALSPASAEQSAGGDRLYLEAFCSFRPRFPVTSLRGGRSDRQKNYE